MPTIPFLSRKLKVSHKAQSLRAKDAALQEMIRIWELECVPDLLHEIDSERQEGQDTPEKKFMRAFLGVVSTKFVTKMVVLHAPESSIPKKKKPALNSDARTMNRIIER